MAILRTDQGALVMISTLLSYGLKLVRRFLYNRTISDPKFSPMEAFENLMFNIASAGTRAEREAGHIELKFMMDKVEAQLQRLRGLHNTLTPCGRLPSEVLCKIFRLLAADELHADRPSHYDMGTRREMPQWITVVNVCAHWRHVALGCSVLWARLDSRNVEEWVTETLIRSKDAPLVVDMKLDDCSSLFEFITRASAHRIRHLTIGKSQRAYLTQSALDGCIAGINAAPVLETLIIDLPPAHKVETKPLPLSIVELMYNAPVLRALSMRCCVPTWDLPVFRQLTSLTVKDLSPSTRPSIDTLIRTIKNTTGLTHLEFTATLPTDPFAKLSTTAPLVLPHLKSLHIKDTCLIATTSFLSRITYPRLVELELDCFLMESPFLDTVSAVPNLTEALEDLPFGPIRRLALKQPTENGVKLEVWDGLHLDEHERYGRGGTISLRLAQGLFTPGSKPLISPRPVTRLLKLFKLDALEQLSVSGGGLEFNPGEWHEWFGYLTKLTKITIASESWSFLMALLKGSGLNADGVSWKLFPALRYIKLLKMWTTWAHFDSHLCQVLELLDKRRIPELEIEKCLFLQVEDVTTMKKFVGELTWKRLHPEDDV